ncbi:MAG: hypothetical protein ACRCYO_06225 [Bacteroidia bacterium]
MNQAATPASTSDFKRFFYRIWLPNIIITTILLVLLLWCWSKYTGINANRNTFLINLSCLVAAAVHTTLLLIFCIRRLTMKHYRKSMSLLAHTLVSGIMTYYLFLVLSVFGWVFIIRGNG